MWKVDVDRAYPFRHQHNNLFPPRPQPLCIPPPLTPDRIPLSTCYEESDEDEDAEIPIIYHSPLVQTTRNISYATSAFPEPIIPPPFTFDMEPPPAPSSVAPANLTNLLQDVLGVMNTIMESRAEVEEEDAILQELAELVFIMQEEAEMLIEVSDWVEEYCGEIESEAEIQEMEEWCLELGMGSGNQLSKLEETSRLGHEREDSGIGLNKKYEGEGDFVDDKSLEEMEALSSHIGYADGSLDEINSEKKPPSRDKNKRASQSSPIFVVTPPPKSTSRDVRGRQESRKTKKAEVTPPARQITKKDGKMKKAPSPFRDSGLGLQSPSPRRSPSPMPRSPRWI